MLVLTRKKNDTIIINDQITIKVLRVQGNRIRIGIDAPAMVPIRRGELGPVRACQRTVDIEPQLTESNGMSIELVREKIT